MFKSVEAMPIKNSIIILICSITMLSCKTKERNQMLLKKREGLWTEQYALDSAKYRSIGYYKNDNPVKTWKYYLDNHLIKKEKYKKEHCKTKLYHKNRKLRAKGITNLDQREKSDHWYYDKTWKYYDENRKLTTVRRYSKGTLVSEILSCKNAKLQSN